MKKIINCNNAKHLSEVMNDLPSNCIFNKVTTGCGGTTVALSNDENYVIAVPTTELIVNKLKITEAGESTIEVNGKQIRAFGWFGFQDYNNKKAMAKYLKSDGTKKLLVTYDKVSAVLGMMKGIGVNPADYRLLVDEYHLLLKAYSYRMKAINGVLNSFKNFKSYVFMSATPISADFCPKQLSDVDIVEAQWDEVNRLKVELVKTNKPYVKAAQFINLMKKNGCIKIGDKVSKHLFFFINSVTDIVSIAQHCNLTNEEVKIICANTVNNENTLNEYNISNSTDKRDVPFTFCTSKAFEGCDFFCEDALSIVISNTRNRHTLLDVSTDIPQIAGRIRDAKVFNDYLIHVFSTARENILDVTEDEVKAGVEAKIKEFNLIAEHNNMLPFSARQLLMEKLPEEYFELKNGILKFNESLLRLKYYEFKVQTMMYKEGIALRKAYEDNGCETSNIHWNKMDGKLKRANCKTDFKTAFLAYANAEDKKSEEAQKMAALFMLDLSTSLIEEAYTKLGEDKVRNLKYSRPSIVKALENLDSTRSFEAKVAKMVFNEFAIGFYTLKEINNKLGTIFDLCKGNSAEEIGSTKATMIEDYFECKATSTRVDGKKVKGYSLIAPKIILEKKATEKVEEDGQVAVDFAAVAYNEAVDKIKEALNNSSLEEQHTYAVKQIEIYAKNGMNVKEIMTWVKFCGFNIAEEEVADIVADTFFNDTDDMENANLMAEYELVAAILPENTKEQNMEVAKLNLEIKAIMNNL